MLTVVQKKITGFWRYLSSYTLELHSTSGLSISINIYIILSLQVYYNINRDADGCFCVEDLHTEYIYLTFYMEILQYCHKENLSICWLFPLNQ